LLNVSVSDCDVLLNNAHVLSFHPTENALHLHYVNHYPEKAISVAAWFTASVCGRSLAGIVGSNPTGGMDVSLL
jgi:hypothetical protein